MRSAKFNLSASPARSFVRAQLSRLSNRFAALSSGRQPIELATTFLLLILACAFALASPSSNGFETLATLCAFLLIARSAMPLFGFVNEVRVKFAEASAPLDRMQELFHDNDKAFVVSGPDKFFALKESIECSQLDFG